MYQNRAALTFYPGLLLVGEVFCARADDHIHVVDTENLPTQQAGGSCQPTYRLQAIILTDCE